MNDALRLIKRDARKEPVFLAHVRLARYEMTLHSLDLLKHLVRLRLLRLGACAPLEQRTEHVRRLACG